MFDNAEIIDSYSRAQAIEDGVLIDVTETAKEAGIRVPLVLTRAAWANCVEWTAETKQRKGSALQDEAGRLWDVLVMTNLAIARQLNSSTAVVKLWRVPPTGDDIGARPTELRVHIGPGDHGEPVMTVSMPNED